MSLLKGKSRNWIITLLLSSAAVAYVFFVFLPSQKAIGESRRELQSKQQYIIDADRLAHAMQQAGSDLEEAQQFADDWRSAAPSEADLAQLLGRITDQAHLAGTKIVKLDRKQLTRLDAVWHVPVELQCQGDFQQVFQFIARLEELPENIWVDQLRIDREIQQTAESRRGGETGEHVLAEVVLMIFADNRDNSN